MFMRKNKPAQMSRRVMIVNGAEQFEEGRAQNYLRDQHLKVLSAAYNGFEDLERLAMVVSTDEIASHDFNLNITRYVNLGEDAETIRVAEEVKKLETLVVERNAAEAVAKILLQELGYVR